MIFHLNICIRNMIIPNTSQLRLHVYFYFRLSEFEMSTKPISFGNYGIIYLFSLFIVRKVNIQARKGYKDFRSLHWWIQGISFFS